MQKQGDAGAGPFSLRSGPLRHGGGAMMKKPDLLIPMIESDRGARAVEYGLTAALVATAATIAGLLTLLG